MTDGAARHRASAVAALLVAGALVLLPMVSAGSQPDPTLTPAAVQAEGGEPALSGDQQELIDQLEHQSGGEVTTATSTSTDTVTFVGAEADRSLEPARSSAVETADHLLAQVGSQIGEPAGPADLVPVRTSDGLNGTAVRYQQTKHGVPVVGGEVSVQLDAAGDAVSVLADLSPNAPAPPPSLGVAVDPSAALGSAVDVVASAQGLAASALQATAAELWYYNPALLGAPGLDVDRLVWRTEVSDGSDAVRELVLVDASTGEVTLHFDQAEEALDRRVCDLANTPSPLNPCFPPFDRAEGDPPTGDAQVDMAYDVAGDFYSFIQTRFGRDSVDGAGLPLHASVRYCPTACPFANAQWTGQQAVFGDGWAVDDVVAHEFGHGLTQYQSTLFYYWQSGAINESFSDMWGELVDLTNGRGTDTAAVRWLVTEDRVGGAIRDMADPPTHNDPDRMQSPLYHPGPFMADNGGVHTNSGVNNKAVYLMVDGDTFNGVTVSPIGLEKTAAVYYEASESFLTSASDYHDLGVALVQACTNLIGTFGITAADCTEVSDATIATEMQLLPNIPGQQAEAPVCADGLEPTFLYQDDFEDPGAGAWTATATPAATGLNTGWYYPQTTFGLYPLLDPTYATSGVTNLFGFVGGATGDASIAMTSDVSIPGGDPTYLRFNRAYEFADPADGGVVEYSSDGGATWSDLGSLFDVNGYVGTISAGGTNPLAGRAGFVGSTLGYGSSRADLSSLAGSDLRIRFRFGTNSAVALLGYVIDDVSLYQCSEPQASTTTTTTSTTSTTAPATSTSTTPGPTSTTTGATPSTFGPIGAGGPTAAGTGTNAGGREVAATGAERGLPTSGADSARLVMVALGLIAMGGLLVATRARSRR